MDYNKTICLPKTDFPMRAGLPKREPEMLKGWEAMDLYHELVKKNEGKPRFSLDEVKSAVEAARMKRAGCQDAIPAPGMTDAYLLVERLIEGM